MEQDALELLARVFDGEKQGDVIEEMEKRGQLVAIGNPNVSKKQLPEEMQPDKSVYEKVGFVFLECTGDGVMQDALIPADWSVKATDHAMWNDIFDEQGRKRGNFFYKASFYDRRAHMNLHNRLDVHSVKDGDNTIVYFGEDGEKGTKLHIAGQYSNELDAWGIFNEGKRTDAKRELWKMSDDVLDALRNELNNKAKEFGAENYPEYQDELCYWDLDLAGKGVTEIPAKDEMQTAREKVILELIEEIEK